MDSRELAEIWNSIDKELKQLRKHGDELQMGQQELRTLLRTMLLAVQHEEKQEVTIEQDVRSTLLMARLTLGMACFTTLAVLILLVGLSRRILRVVEERSPAASVTP